MEVKRGYKQTEVGVIPEDWEVVNYAAVGQIIDGDRGTHYPSAGELLESGYCLFLNAGNVTKDGFRFADCQFVSQEKDGKLSKGKLARGDVVLTTRGTIGNFAYFDEDVPYEQIRINSGMVILRNISPAFSRRYHYLILRSQIVESQLERLSFGSAQPQLTVGGISTLAFPLPPTTDEQEAIAEALSDADALIESLEQLLTKKRQIKQGAMQELLTGKKRLPGFSGNWEMKRLGDIAHIKTGGRNNQDKIEDGEYPFFVRSATVERINSYSYDCEAILIPGEGGIGSIFHYICGRFDVHQRVYAITEFRPDVSGRYVHLYMSVEFGVHAMQNSVKATVDSLRLPTFQNFEVALPPTLAEQTAIASVLSDMDSALSALETGLTKARQLKQGMMQELLTGRIRVA